MRPAHASGRPSLPLWTWWVAGLALGALLLLPGRARAQGFGGVFPGGGGAASTPSPTRDDVAASYTATGASGYKFTAQSSLGECSGAPRLVMVSDEVDGPIAFLCDGSSWWRVYTERDGTLNTPTGTTTARAFTANAPSAAVAFRLSSNGARLQFGTGASTYLYTDGETVKCESSFAVGTSGVLYVNNIVAANTSERPVAVLETRGLRITDTTTLGTCGTVQAPLGTTVYYKPAASKLRPCLCLASADGTTFYWHNLAAPSDTTGTATTCPATP